MTSSNEKEGIRNLFAEAAIKRVLIAYATTVDTRSWREFDDIFVESAQAVYGSNPSFQFTCEGRAEIREMCKVNLDGCGPTQHLLTNFQIDIEGERASSVCSVQAGHFGKGANSDKRYEMWGEYRDELLESSAGWRITRRQLHVIHEFGDRDQVLSA
jgi:3-phenylpropionate/cinnamic acid dioxygenase small subunit